MPATDSDLKERLLLAAAHGWTKPSSDIPAGLRLAGFLDPGLPTYDADFARKLAAVRPDWTEGPGISLAGARHHSAWTATSDDEAGIEGALPRP